jgi:hypothetical protein
MEDAGEGGTMGDAGAGCARKAGGRPLSPLLQPLPLVRPGLYVVALVPALDLMQILFLAFVLAPRAQQVRYICSIISTEYSPHR